MPQTMVRGRTAKPLGNSEFIMISDNSAEKLVDRAAVLVAAARRAGADHGDAVVMRAGSVSESVRLGKVEGPEASESDDFSLRVFVGRRIASVAANASAD